jgi:predicted nucleic acid-binding protein
MLVLDTGAVSTIMHRVPSSLQKLERIAPNEVVLTAPVAAEIAFGLHRLDARSKRYRVLSEEYRRLRDVVRWADWDEPAATEFGRQKALLQARGQKIEDFDIAIGSMAIRLGARLATHNARHLARLEGLTIDDWGPPMAQRPR